MAHKKDYLRVGAAERDKVIGIIGEHYSLGRLTDEEFQARMVAASDAKTRGDLRVLTADLPKLPAVAPVRRERQDVASRVARVNWYWVFIALVWAILLGEAVAHHG